MKRKIIRPDGNEFSGAPGKSKGLALLLVMALGVYISPVTAQAPPEKNMKLFYQQNCVRCHGPDGSAVSAEDKKLKGQDFTDEKFQRDTSDDEMVDTILNGVFFGWFMPRFRKDLTREQAQEMVTDIIRKCRKDHVIAPSS